MSTATAFRHHRPFPFCPAAPSRAVYRFDTITNLTLADVMSFYWNLESVAFTFAATGDATFGSTHFYSAATGTVGIGPPQRTGNFVNLDYWAYNGAIARAASGTNFSDLPSTTTAPRDRVCGNSILFDADCRYSGDASLVGFPHLFQMSFIVCSDPVHSGRYAIEYRFVIAAGSYTTGQHPRIVWSNPSYSGAAAPLYINAGFFTLGGISFPWGCYGNVHTPYSVVYTGGTMTCTSSNYTY